MQYAWPVGQTPEGNFVFASMVAPSNLEGFAKTTGKQANQKENGEYPDSNHIQGHSRNLRHGRLAPSSTDALTSDEIEELRLAVQNTYRKLQNPNSSGSFDLINQGVTRFAGENRSSKSKDHDSDTLSSSSSTCVPESNLESWENVADDNTHPRNVFHPTDDQLIPDSHVDRMFVELESPNAEVRKKAIEWVVKSTRPLAFTRRGCRIVQRVMEVATSVDQEKLVENLEGFALEALQSPHANYVLQKCFEVASPEKAEILLNELKGQGSFVARHRFGCRVLQRALEHCSLEQNEEWIADVLMDAPQLVRHTYGNFVIQHILRYGSSYQVHQIAEVLLEDAIRFAKHRIASHVMTNALSCCSPDDVQNLTLVLAGDGQLADLQLRQYGSLVARQINRIKTHQQPRA
jgi:hypothetical protein